MRDGANFPDPSEFRPERFLQNGKYKFDPKVCNFSTGLRACPGMTLSRSVLFTLTAALLQNYIMKNLDETVTIIESDGGMMSPQKLNIAFTQRI